ncbi:hypothetical protein EI94DRAFT_784961 [Lactarius quietus]|nr:hypothetical protein EI94DRAFT_784961 [Lactarius quietus]
MHHFPLPSSHFVHVLPLRLFAIMRCRQSSCRNETFDVTIQHRVDGRRSRSEMVKLGKILPVGVCSLPASGCFFLMRVTKHARNKLHAARRLATLVRVRSWKSFSNPRFRTTLGSLQARIAVPSTSQYPVTWEDVTLFCRICGIHNDPSGI